MTGTLVLGESELDCYRGRLARDGWAVATGAPPAISSRAFSSRLVPVNASREGRIDLPA